ncbi:MAG: hypothetical protein LBV16_00385, partial [Elusimicrobiota bacterium]|nr:hypothetical protein [Elusimicrobiota bacterium]
SGCMAVWLSGCLAVWLSGCLAVWLSGCLAVWLSGCLAVYKILLLEKREKSSTGFCPQSTHQMNLTAKYYVPLLNSFSLFFDYETDYTNF